MIKESNINLNILLLIILSGIVGILITWLLILLGLYLYSVSMGSGIIIGAIITDNNVFKKMDTLLIASILSWILLMPFAMSLHITITIIDHLIQKTTKSLYTRNWR